MDRASEKASSVTTSPGSGPRVVHHSPSPAKASKSFMFLLLYTSGSIALAVSMAVGLDGYNAVDTETPRYTDGKLRLRVSDITTLISAAIVIIKFLATSWSVATMWLCAYELTRKSAGGITKDQLSFMVRFKLPPWLMPPFGWPQSGRSWMVALILLFALPQPFISPLLSGAVDWNPTTIPSQKSVMVNSTNPAANANRWNRYTKAGYFVIRSDTVRVAEGFVSMAWTDLSTVSANGTSLTGNGCRHVVNDDSLPINTTLAHSIIPCLQIHSIDWAMEENQTSLEVASLVMDNTNYLSVSEEPLDLHTSSGRAFLFNASSLWNVSNYDQTRGSVEPVPAPFLASGPLTLAVILGSAVNDSCADISSNDLGDDDMFPQYRYLSDGGSCYLFANVTLTAGVTNSSRSTYTSPRVVEDQTPLEEVVILPSPWVQQALWMIPDLMTTVISMNSTRLAKWNNIDLYAETLIRQSYLAAWDGFHRSYDVDGADGGGSILSAATPPESRVRATVSAKRTFVWLFIALLHTIGGVLLMALLLAADEPDNMAEMPCLPPDAGEGEDPGGMAKSIVENVIDGFWYN